MGKDSGMAAKTRAKLIAATRLAFAATGDAATSMGDLTRGALYHNFGDKKGLLAAVVDQIDRDLAQKAQAAGRTPVLKRLILGVVSGANSIASWVYGNRLTPASQPCANPELPPQLSAARLLHRATDAASGIGRAGARL